jgi:NADH-quinone oxidoreductase subunit F
LPLLLAAQETRHYLSEETLSAIARHVHVPDSEVFGVATSYSELRLRPRSESTEIAVCGGLSCLLSGARELATELRGTGEVVELRPCRFRCVEAPIASVDGRYVAHATPQRVHDAAREAQVVARQPLRPASSGEVRRVLARCGEIDPARLDDAIARGAYDGLRRVRQMAPEEVVSLVNEAGLLGRGGAYFPAAAKWSAAREYSKPRYFVVNAEEGEPGVFKDRYLMELDPHLLVEGMAIAAHAIEAESVFVYINGEADVCCRRVEAALGQARDAGLLEGLDVEVRRGAGGYVCGEESVILSSIEGYRAVPRLRPPMPVESGLWGRPTVINNVETLCNLPLIFRDGPSAFRSAGTPQYPGTKLVCVSGSVRNPGLYEVPFGTPLRHVVEDFGGGPPHGRAVRAVLCGGPSGGLLPPERLDIPITPGRLDDGGASLGSGGVIVIDDTMSIRDVVRHLTAYNALESCGKCTPCREGTARMVELLDGATPARSSELGELAEAVAASSLCGLGQMAPLPYLSARRHFPDEFAANPP